MIANFFGLMIETIPKTSIDSYFLSWGRCFSNRTIFIINTL